MPELEGSQSLLQKFGATTAEIALLIPTFMGFTPGTSYKDSTAVISIIKGLQRGLNRLGAKLDVDGRLGPRTNYAIQQVSGSTWATKYWFSLYVDLSNAIEQNKRVTPMPGSLTPTVKPGDQDPIYAAGYGSAGMSTTTMLLIAAAGVAAFFLLKPKRGR